MAAIVPAKTSGYISAHWSGHKCSQVFVFQYKILHDIVFTKSKLFKAKLASNALFCLCLKAKQDLKHMLVTCPVVSEFWKIFLEWSTVELSTVKIV